jgi:ABC-type phosphate/phosphonate transport system substrate-binding protein
MAETIDGSGFTFGLPPSLGTAPVWALARELADVLYDHGFTTVVPFRSYEELEQALHDGEIDAAWGPPLVCARVEAAGGTVVRRGIRDGGTTYRSALVSRIQDVFGIDSLGKGTFRPRAVWVDRSSVGGYLLPRDHLRQRGLAFDDAFLHQKMLGSYAACIDAVIGFEADLTAVFVGRNGLEHAWGPRARRLKALCYTAESPNDGVVVSSTLEPDRVAALSDSLDILLADSRSRDVVAASFSVEGFDRPPRNTYTPLLALL